MAIKNIPVDDRRKTIKVNTVDYVAACFATFVLTLVAGIFM